MKKLLPIVLLFIACAHSKDYTPVDYSHADSIRIVQIRPMYPDTSDIRIRIAPPPLVYREPPLSNINELRSQFRDHLENITLPDNPLPSDSVTPVLRSIQRAFDLAAAHMASEMTLHEGPSPDFISANSDAISFTFRSLNDWFDHQGCVQHVSLPDYENMAHPHIIGQTSMPLQIPVSVTLFVEPDNIATHQFSMLLDREPSFELLLGR